MLQSCCEFWHREETGLQASALPGHLPQFALSGRASLEVKLGLCFFGDPLGHIAALVAFIHLLVHGVTGAKPKVIPRLLLVV